MDIITRSEFCKSLKLPVDHFSFDNKNVDTVPYGSLLSHLKSEAYCWHIYNKSCIPIWLLNERDYKSFQASNPRGNFCNSVLTLPWDEVTSQLMYVDAYYVFEAPDFIERHYKGLVE